MLADHFPPLGLRLTTPRLELRLPGPEELAELAELAAAGVHDPDVMPFAVPWTDAPPAEIVLGTIQHHWRTLADWTPGDWALHLTVFHEGRPVGQQDIAATDLAVTREVRTGSYLGLPHHGKGFGTEMRAAVLHLAFEGLGAELASSIAFADNHASLAVSRKLGYRPNGTGRRSVRGRLAIDQRQVLTRADWEAHRTVPVTIEGLAPCLPHLGLPPAAASTTTKSGEGIS